MDSESVEEVKAFLGEHPGMLDEVSFLLGMMRLVVQTSSLDCAFLLLILLLVHER